MNKLIVNRKSGFFSRNPVRIYDLREDRYVIFYEKAAYNFRFNLPAGIYYTSDTFRLLPKPVNYILPKLPKPKGGTALPEHINVKEYQNPNKCSVIRESGQIIMDPSLTKLPIPSIVHVLFHEIGHYFYGDTNDPDMESKCDIFASYQMLKRGFNPSQCIKAVETNLSGPSAIKRNNKHFNFIKYVTHGR